ncbi:MAG: hypothetical protein FGM14_15300 [Flavobacteriales bacterium]|nr:hypothetical protein [Flavobacteriales bacterium]
MSNNNETPCGAIIDESINIHLTGENNDKTLSIFLNNIKEKIKEVKSNQLILKCQIYPTHFFDLD